MSASSAAAAAAAAAAPSSSNGSKPSPNKRKAEENANGAADPKKAKSDAASADGDAPVVRDFKMSLHRVVDKEHATKPLSEIIKLPPSALKGVSEGRGDELFRAFHLHTIEDAGRWSFFHASKAIVELADAEPSGDDSRPHGARFNIDKALDKSYETKSFKELAESPVSCLEGLADWVDPLLNEFHITTVRQLANWRFLHWAESLVTLAKYEVAGEMS